MKRILGLGSALIDILAPIPSDDLIREVDLSKGGMTLIDHPRQQKLQTLFQEFEISEVLGGSASNTISGLARLGVPTGFIGKVGNDRLGELFHQTQRDEKTTPYLLRGKAATGCAMTLISPDGERTFGTYLGASSELCADELDPALFSGLYDTLFIEGYLIAVDEHRLVRRAVQMAKAAGMTVALDMVSHNLVTGEKDFFRELFNGYVDIVFANEEEAQAYTGLSGEGAARSLAAECKTAIVKRGAKGALVASGNTLHAASAFPAACRDTTGAGDLFAAGYLYGCTQGCAPDRCIRLGNAVAARVIEVIGTRMSDETWDKIKLNIAEIKGC